MTKKVCALLFAVLLATTLFSSIVLAEEPPTDPYPIEGPQPRYTYIVNFTDKLTSNGNTVTATATLHGRTGVSLQINAYIQKRNPTTMAWANYGGPYISSRVAGTTGISKSLTVPSGSYRAVFYFYAYNGNTIVDSATDTTNIVYIA